MSRYTLSAFISSLLVLIFSFPATAQVLAGFENIGLRPGEHLNNAYPEDGFQSGSLELPNFYDANFDYWSGWAISADTNTRTPGFLNQYSSITGGGARSTSSYSVAYVYDPALIRLRYNAVGKPMIGMYVTNSTYAYLSMRDGDAFAKKFGGETGTDPDFFRLTIKKYAGGVLADDSLDIYLADYRFSDPGKDYILSDWKYVDLSVLGEVDSLSMTLISSDVGVFGMNTPAYFCMDEVSTDNLLSSSNLYADAQLLQVNPNPAQDVLLLDVVSAGQIGVTSIEGRSVWSGRLETGHHELNISTWPRGLYFVTCNGQITGRITAQ